ncbi:MAG: mitochondrial fission ELM1 family protein [Rhodospirillales bacterium]|nr:mitochondrial fission ELM1 family protein [Rhodospirillales bacterium]
MQELSKNITKKLSCWVVTEGFAGTENQCLGVAEALGAQPEVKRIGLRQPWKALSPYLGFENAYTFTSALKAPWPDLLIASGRKSIAASRYIKKMSGGKIFTVQIQDPRVNPAQFDLIAVPAHDPTRGDNVIVTTSAPNRVTATRLEKAKEEFAAFDALPSPRIAVMIGGNSKAYRMDAIAMRKLVIKLSKLEGSLMVSASRRTGEEGLRILHETFDESDHFLWDGQGPNPYFGMLAWADIILVTADSASMLSESCSTGKPVYMVPLDARGKRVHPRIDKLHENLRQSGCLRDFDGYLESWSYEPLHDADIVAQEIRKRMNL